MSWSHRQRVAYVKRVREAIFDALGRVCVTCGQEGDHTEAGKANPLEFDHKNGRAYSLAKLSRWQRVALLKREHARGEIRVMCRRCNAQDGNDRKKGGG